MRSLLFLCCASLAFSQPQGGTEAKAKPQDYDVHGQAGDVTLGAEFMVHSYSGKNQTYIVNNCLVVEVALFPAKDGKVDVRTRDFNLRINGKKPLVPVSPQMVASMMQRPEWQSGPHLEAGGGIDNAGVILGRPVPSDVPGGRGNPRRQDPVPDNPNMPPSEPRIAPPELLLQTALPEVQSARAVSGFIYFPYKGKTSSIKTLELLYGDAVLKLR